MIWFIQYLLIITLYLPNTVSADEFALPAHIPKSKLNSLEQSECENLDIRDKNPKLREHFSVPRDQGTIGWCYGHVAADMLSIETGQPISAAHVASIYNRKLYKNPFFRVKAEGISLIDSLRYKKLEDIEEGGFANHAFLLASKQKILCKESDFSNSINNWKRIESLIYELESISEVINERKYRKYKKFEKECSNIKLFLDSYPEIKMNAEEVYAALLKENINIALADIVDKHCKKNTIKVSPLKLQFSKSPNHFESAKLTSGNEFMAQITGAIKKGKPVGITYNAKHVKKNKGDFHASLVVAQKWSEGKCQFKIRNSWGKTCSEYDPLKIESCNREEGSYWVSDQKLFEMVEDITFTESKSPISPFSSKSFQSL